MIVLEEWMMLFRRIVKKGGIARQCSRPFGAGVFLFMTDDEKRATEASACLGHSSAVLRQKEFR
jgi:hypothetical protein